jgi:dCMP deaminase
MSERPSFKSIYMRLALMMAERSTCSRLNVGCVITSVDYRYVYGVGYNGNATGLYNGCDSKEPGKCGCLHAEENAVINCTAPRDAPKVVFTTNLPCPMCSKRLINMGGVQLVYYHRDYRIRDGLQHLRTAGIKYEQLGVEP